MEEVREVLNGRFILFTPKTLLLSEDSHQILQHEH